jgi:hypothetical protein
MSVLIRARQRTGPTVHAGLTDGVAACAPPGIANAASAAAQAEIFHAFNRITASRKEAQPNRRPQYPGKWVGKPGNQHDRNGVLRV